MKQHVTFARIKQIVYTTRGVVFGKQQHSRYSNNSFYRERCEDVGEEDDAVRLVIPPRLERDLRRQLRSLRPLPKRGVLRQRKRRASIRPSRFCYSSDILAPANTQKHRDQTEHTRKNQGSKKNETKDKSSATNTTAVRPKHARPSASGGWYPK